MHHQFTPAAARALDFAARTGGHERNTDVRPPALLLALAAEPECRAAMLLEASGVDTRAIVAKWPHLKPGDNRATVAPPDSHTCHEGSPALPPLSPEVEAALDEAAGRLAEYAEPVVLATEHLLLGLATTKQPVGDWLLRCGLDADTIEADIAARCGHRPGPLPLDFEENHAPDETSPQAADQGQSAPVSPKPGPLPEGTGPRQPPRPQPLSPGEGQQVAALRALDAAANRGREGFRVVEDYLRFVLDDRHLTELCKHLRHDLTAALDRFAMQHRLAARDTRADVGTTVSTPSERRRESLQAVVAANFTRLQESLRSLEEFGKLFDPAAASAFEQLRYRSYTLHRAVEITGANLERLADARLYVLIDGCQSPDAFERLAQRLVHAGVDLLQLRDKQLADRELLDRARRLRDITAGTATRFIMNDRPDLAALSRADGVHVGQEELSVKDARSIVGPDALVGRSTHSIDQARQAVLDGADYIGVGPTFPSGTKHFDQFPGLDLLREVAGEIRLPAFAIGGITAENLAEVLATGIGRVAVSGAVCAADDPAGATRRLLAALSQ